MKATTPEIVAAADAGMHCKDWLYLNLTGVRATDPSEACFTFGDFRTRAYDDEVIAALGLTARTRACCRRSSTARKRRHPLSAAAATATGLKAGTPVVPRLCRCGLHGARRWHSAPEATPARCTIIGSTGMHMRACTAGEAFI